MQETMWMYTITVRKTLSAEEGGRSCVETYRLLAISALRALRSYQAVAASKAGPPELPVRSFYYFNSSRVTWVWPLEKVDVLAVERDAQPIGPAYSESAHYVRFHPTGPANAMILQRAYGSDPEIGAVGSMPPVDPADPELTEMDLDEIDSAVEARENAVDEMLVQAGYIRLGAYANEDWMQASGCLVAPVVHRDHLDDLWQQQEAAWGEEERKEAEEERRDRTPRRRRPSRPEAANDAPQERTATASFIDRGDVPYVDEPRFELTINTLPPRREVWDGDDPSEVSEILAGFGVSLAGPWEDQGHGVWDAPVMLS